MEGPGTPGRSRAGDDGDAADLEAVRKIARADTAGLDAAYQAHSKAVYETARGVLGRRPLAEEVVQDVFLNLWNRPDRFDQARGTLRTYLLTISFRRSVDLARSESARRRREEGEAEQVRRQESEHAGDVDIETTHTLRDAVSTLGQDEREAISLAYFLGYSYREAATALGVPEGTVKNRIRKGLSRLRDQLESREVGWAS